MAIFSRRTIQRLINENLTIFNMPVKEQVKLLNKKENSFNNEFLAREWEIVVLNTFAKTFAGIGKVVHEKKFNKKALDIFFESSTDPKLNFVADICTISDYGTDEKFPIEELEKRFYRIISEKGLNPSFFNIRVGDNSHLISREKGGVILYIPNRKEFDKKIFNDKFTAFLERVERNLSFSQEDIIDEVEFKIPKGRKTVFYNRFLSWYFNNFHKTKIFKYLLSNRRFRSLVNEFATHTLISFSYIPNQRFSFNIANNHKSITLLENNTLFYRLREKCKQLNDSKTSFAKGIIVCDGNYEPFSSIYSAATQWTSKHYDAKDVITHFFKKPEFSEIDFILFFGVYPYGETNNVVSKCYIKPKERQIDDSILEILKKDNLISNIPTPERTVGNAINRLKSKYKNLGSKVGSSVESNKIKISSRAILEMLSGKISIEDFADDNFHPIIGNPFETKLKEGRLITSVEIEYPKDEKDDEYIIFNFGEPDVAISDFKNPIAPKKK